RLGSLDRKIDADGFQGLLILRLLPIVPFNLLNYVAGLTTIPWREYASATAIGILPGTVVYVLFSDALLSGSAAAGRGALLRAGIAGMILVVFSLVTRQFLRRKRASSQS
ncbi:MAG: VTT domain-containing protein, partial [Gemmatimonadota bacterium]